MATHSEEHASNRRHVGGPDPKTPILKTSILIIISLLMLFYLVVDSSSIYSFFGGCYSHSPSSSRRHIGICRFRNYDATATATALVAAGGTYATLGHIGIGL